MKVALVHDWLTGFRGGERVLEAICELYPTADIFTLVHQPGSTSPRIEAMRPRASWLRWLSGVHRYYRACLPLFPTLIEQFDLDSYDLVISTSHCVAKSVVRPGRIRHLCYCHTPMRYAWDQFEAYFGPQRLGPIPSAVARHVMARIARWDAATAGRVDRYVANSQHVARRIGRYYNRDAAVVYPPVDTTFFSPDATDPEPWCLVVSALVPYKRVDVAIEACHRASLPLRVVGSGPERERLAALGGDRVEFLGSRSPEELRDLYRRASVLVHAGEEDFGIALVEAQAVGRPVVALAQGGALEIVEDERTGFLVWDQTPEAFARRLRDAVDHPLDPAVIRQRALAFDRARFASAFPAQVTAMLAAAPC